MGTLLSGKAAGWNAAGAVMLPVTFHFSSEKNHLRIPINIDSLTPKR